MEEIKIGQQRVFLHRLSAEEMELSKRQEVLISLLQKQVNSSIAQIEHDFLGKPFLADFPFISISISHAADWIAFAISEYGDIGIDLEIENPKIKSASSLFLNAEEKTVFNHPTVRDLHLIWGAKEAVYKYFGGTIQSLQKDITIIAINQDQKQIHVNIYDQLYCCNYQIISEKYYLVVCATAVPTQ